MAWQCIKCLHHIPNGVSHSCINDELTNMHVKCDSLEERLRVATCFDEEKDGPAIVEAAEKSKLEYFTPKTDWTIWGDKMEIYEHGFYAGALYQRETAKNKLKGEGE